MVQLRYKDQIDRLPRGEPVIGRRPHPEANAMEWHGILVPNREFQMTVADDPSVQNGDIPGRESRLGVPNPEGLQKIQLTHQAMVDLPKVDLHINVQSLLVLRGWNPFPGELGKAVPERGDLRLVNRKSRRAWMPSEPDQKIPARRQRRVEIEPRHGAR